MFLELTAQFYFLYTSIKLFHGPTENNHHQLDEMPIRIWVSRITTGISLAKNIYNVKLPQINATNVTIMYTFIWTAYNIIFSSLWMHYDYVKTGSSPENGSHADWLLIWALYRTAFVITGTIEVTATVNQTKSISSASTRLC